MSNIVIGIDQGSYTVNAGTRQVTLSGLTFTPTVESLLYFFNTTQDKQYFAQAETYAKDITITPSGDDYILTYQDIFPELVAGNKIHIQFWIASTGVVSDGNSTSTPLVGDAVFPGETIDILNYPLIYVNVFSDKTSATDGLCIEQSSDGTNWDHDDCFTIAANSGKNFSIQRYARYLRVRYINGVDTQTAFRLQTILSVNSKPSSHRVKDQIIGDDDAELGKVVITADSGNGQDYKDIDAQHPLSADGDSVYEKDIDQVNSTTDGFTGGTIINLFNDIDGVLINSSGTNPKIIRLELKRPITSNILGLTTVSGSFSNTKIVATVGEGADKIDVSVIDESADNTDKTLLIPNFSPITFNVLQFEFYTTDAVSVSYIGISKTIQTIARIQGTDPDGVVRDVNVTVDGNLSISNNSSGLAIAKGDVTGTTFIHKFGNAPDFDTADGIVSIWDGTDNADIAQTDYIYSTTAIIDSLSSSSGADTQDIEVQGLDANYDLVVQTITITGQTRKALDTNLLRVFRMKNVNSIDNVGHIYCYENTAILTGVPIDTTKVRAVMQPLNNQTLMALFTIPLGKTGYMRDWYAATAGGNKDSNYIVDLRARPFGQVFQLKHRSALSDKGTSSYKHPYVEPEVFVAKTDIEMRVESVALPGVTGASVSAGFDIVMIDD